MNYSENDDSYRASHGTSPEEHLRWLHSLELDSTWKRSAGFSSSAVYQLFPIALMIGFSVTLIIVALAYLPR